MTTEPNPKPKARRGFAAMSPELRRELAARGGAAVPPGKRSFSFDRDLASAAGSKGGATRRKAADEGEA